MEMTVFNGVTYLKYFCLHVDYNFIIYVNHTYLFHWLTVFELEKHSFPTFLNTYEHISCHYQHYVISAVMSRRESAASSE